MDDRLTRRPASPRSEGADAAPPTGPADSAGHDPAPAWWASPSGEGAWLEAPDAGASVPPPMSPVPPRRRALERLPATSGVAPAPVLEGLPAAPPARLARGWTAPRIAGVGCLLALVAGVGIVVVEDSMFGGASIVRDAVRTLGYVLILLGIAGEVVLAAGALWSRLRRGPRDDQA